MRKTLFIVLLIILPLKLFSQNKNIDFGIKAGINYSNYKDNIDLNIFTHIPADYTGKLGFYIGAYSDIEINEMLSIKPELLISKTGTNATIDFKHLQNIYTSQDTVVYQVTEASINEYSALIPILLSLNIKKYFFEIGPQFGYTFSRNISYKNGPINSHLILKDSNSESFELAAAIGAGYKISELYEINIRYSYGFTERQHLNSSILYFGLSYKL